MVNLAFTLTKYLMHENLFRYYGLLGVKCFCVMCVPLMSIQHCLHLEFKIEDFTAILIFKYILHTFLCVLYERSRKEMLTVH